MTETRRRIDRRAAQIRAEREQRVGFWRRLGDWLSGIDRAAEQEAERRAQERAEAQARANRAFPAVETHIGLSAGYRTGPDRGWLSYRRRDDYRHLQE